MGHSTSSPTRITAENANAHSAITTSASIAPLAYCSVSSMRPASSSQLTIAKKTPRVRNDTANERIQPTGTPSTRRAACTSSQA